MSKVRNHLEKHVNKPWKRVIYNTCTGYFDMGISLYTSSLTYYLIFAIFPCLIFMSTMLAFWDLSDLLNNAVVDEIVNSVIPKDIKDLLESTIFHMQETYTSSFITIGLFFSMWFVWRAISRLLLIIQYIYQDSGYKYKWIPNIIFSVLIVIFVPIYMVVLLIGQNFFDFVNLFIPVADNLLATWNILKYVPLSLGAFLMFSVLYAVAVKRKMQRRFILPGAIIGATVWILFSYCFAFYVNHMGSYSLVYGSIGTVIAFLVWVNASILTILMGAVFNQCLYCEYGAKG